MAELGRIEKVELRTQWPDESRDFTPWLARPENIALLGEALGREFEVEQTEKMVGGFYADILCRDTTTNGVVLIENQLETTDHGHLGQLLTYAAGLHARTIIWVARTFRDEHRAALDWLNEVTAEDIEFFGVEVELLRIGDSSPAPRFNLVSYPNDWSRGVVSASRRGELTEDKSTQLEFWTAFRAFMEQEQSPVRCTKPFPANWMSHSIGRAGFQLVSIASMFDSAANQYGGEVRVDLYIGTTNAKAHFAELERSRAEIEAAVGEPLVWQNRPETKTAKIYVRRSADITDRTLWPDLHRWLKDRLERFHRVFQPRVRALS